MPTDSPGWVVARLEDKLGQHSSDTAQILFENCRIPRRYLLGEEDMGFYYLMNNFQGERIAAAVMACSGAM